MLDVLAAIEVYPRRRRVLKAYRRNWCWCTLTEYGLNVFNATGVLVGYGGRNQKVRTQRHLLQAQLTLFSFGTVLYTRTTLSIDIRWTKREDGKGKSARVGIF